MWPRLVGGVVLGLLGIVWTLQGLDVLGGSGMSGKPIWAVIGIVAIAAAAWLLRSANAVRHS